MKLRAFQERIIKNSDYFLNDNQMHIVAPPGSGKTVIGVEMIKKINLPTLVLVPSLILKNQWLTVLANYYEASNLSDNLATSQLITVTTYQNYYSNKECILNNFSAEFIILDEAHHLKKAWANELLRLKENKELKFLSLTATPPYDATSNEWETYIELNGNIDEEVSTSELIKDGILAPYQDYLYLLPVSRTSQDQLEKYFARNEAIKNELLTSQEIAYTLINSDFISFPLKNSTFIFENLALYLSSLSYLANQGYLLNKDHWQIIGLEKRKRQVIIPPPDNQDIENILNYLYELEPNMEIFTYLKKMNWLDEKGLTLFPNYQPTQKEELAPLKKEAIEHIVVKEELFLGKKLCGIVFLDFIKENALINPDDFLDLGVVPVFLRLEKLVQENTEIAAICGSFLIISETLITQVKELTIYESEIVLTAPNYKKINFTEQNRGKLTKLITNLLNQKIINILIGTVSFLGEGWNCPNLNTIILGNSTSSFVQTQQLRGRGLRIAEQKELTNIWHISPVYTNISLDQQTELAPIIKRLSFIEGLDFSEVPSITSNIERFDIPKTLNSQQINARISDNFEKAKARNYFVDKWKTALYNGKQLVMPVSIKNQFTTTEEVPSNPLLKDQSKENFFSQFNWWFFPKLRKKRQWKIYCKKLEAIMIALHKLLVKEGIISQQEKLNIDWNEQNFSCSIQSDSYYTKSRFNRLSVELLSELENPRYLLKIEQHYFPVPQSYAINRKKADLFFNYVLAVLPKTELFYTKNIEGRKELMNAYFTQNKKTVLQHKIWR